jgi:hypothetical protein
MNRIIYTHTFVNWGSYAREIFCEFVYSTYKDLVFDGDVEIDESWFGRRVKYNRGNPTIPEYGYLQWYNEVLIR